MARRVHVIVTDDVDGSEAAETVMFALEGLQYEIDLSEANAAQFRDSLRPWVERARRRTGRRGGSATSKAGKEKMAQIRRWGRQNGFQVSERGRISQALQDAYSAAHGR